SSGTASLAVDGNTNTRWESAFSDPQWISLDLGAEYNVSKVVIRWEAANARDYTLEGSTDGSSWTVIQSLQNLPGGNRIDTLKSINATYRYLKINGTARNLNYGYSIWEIEVFQVSVPVLSGLKVSPSNVTAKAGDTVTFTAIGLDQNNDPYPLADSTVWTVNDTNAVVDSEGRFVAIKPGFFTVTATNGTFTDNAQIEALPQEANITALARAYASTGNAALAIDGNTGTRWESAFADPQWIMLVLDTIHRIYGFRIQWEAANAKDYIIEGSADSISWDTIVQKNNMAAGSRVDVIYDLDNADYKYIRLTGISRNLVYGYSIWEFNVYERSKIKPVVSWTNPSAITYGTALSNSQLNASANVAGTFVYYPAMGTLLNAGTHTLYAYFYPDDPLTYARVKDSVTLVVNQAKPIINWAQPDTLFYGYLLGSQQLNATVAGDIAGQFVYTPAEGTLLGAGKHTLMVTFVPNDTANYMTASESVTIVVKKAIPVIQWDNPAPIVYGTALSATQLSAIVEGFDGTYSYNVSIGTMLNAGTHTLSVTFYPEDSANVESVSSSVQLQVEKTIPTVHGNFPAVFSYGKKLAEWPLIADIEGTISYSLPIDSVLPVGVYIQVMSFTPSDTANYFSYVDTLAFTVVKATPTLQWETPADITYGTPLSAVQLNATCQDVPGNIEYSVTMDSILVAGVHTIRATFIPSDTVNYEMVTKEVELTVLKAMPILIWNTPDGITEGTALTNTQLNATANVAGTFIYSPELGTVLSAGTHVLSVTFVPSDTANYLTATAEVTIKVVSQTSVSTGDVAKISIFPNPCVDYVA
ncbi:MAG: discoidin domain-containing protein, partial [Bacteroidales bacterium]